MVVQLITILGVAVGAALSYFGSSMTERKRYERAQQDRWEERKLDAYASYLDDVKQMRAIARRMLRDTGIDASLPIALSADEGLPQLAEAEARRSRSAGRIRLIGSTDVVKALETLDRAIWKIEWFARGLINADAEGWYEASAQYHAAMNAFEDRVRHDLRVPVPRDRGQGLPKERFAPSGQDSPEIGPDSVL